MVSAYRLGNLTAMINDGSYDPYDAESGRRGANCRFVEVLRGGWCLPCVLTTADVEPGGELLLDYGAGYWEGQRAVRGRLDRCADWASRDLPRRWHAQA